MAVKKKPVKKVAPKKAKPIKQMPAEQAYEPKAAEKPKFSLNNKFIIGAFALVVLIGALILIANANIDAERILPVKEYAKAAVGIACTDKCGDGFCDEVVCMAEGCPCSENYRTCPRDCHEARFEDLAEFAKDSECIEKGELTPNYAFNPETRTWWINMKMKPEFEKEGCNPACVIYESDKKVELNWRCTGLVAE
ncbi:MAG: hypothetical protein PHO02_05535 [Candidatus Nanoarchaeia archaeon]|nr:hypothetical protein [Candidatus Nanoarchaeia archaeon]